MKKIYLIATIAAIITGFTVYLFAKNLEEKSTMISENLIPVVVADSQIPVDTVIEPLMLKTVLLPKDSVGETILSNIEDAVGKTAKYPIFKGEQILSDKIVKVGETNNNELRERIQKGYRAFTIPVDDITGMAGYLKQGDKVDIIASRTINGVAITTMILQNINIIAIGNYAPSSNEDSSSPASYTNVTVEIPASETIRLHHEIVNGFVKLILRNSSDAEIGSFSAVN